MQIYIHIPFCDLKCKYCRFASVGNVQNLHIEKYVNFLCKEILNSNFNNKNINTIYFGGGTPSVLNKKHLENIFNSLKAKFIFDKDIEITLESTPNNITEINLKNWTEIGINRFSIGIQTLNEKSLKEINRGNKGDVNKCLDILKKYGKFNISLDFIIGLPYVKSGEILENIEFILKKYDFIKHISVYMLEEYYSADKIIETKFDNITYPKNWDKLGIKDDDYLKEYTKIKKYLIEKKFNNYEISNFGKNGFECKHNIGYWNHKEVLAFGMGAGGFIDGFRYLNADNFKDYYLRKKIFEDKLSENDIFLEKLLFQARTSGIKKNIYEKLNQNKINYFIENGYLIYKSNILTESFDTMLFKNKLKKNQLVKTSSGQGVLKLTNSGILIMDYILGEIV